MLRLLKAGNASTMTFAKSGHPSTWTLGSSVGFECVGPPRTRSTARIRDMQLRQVGGS
jgi:hypothetical protein